MGKNKKGGKKSNVFKVAGAKSLKAKSKAKPVTGNLKKINEIVRKNIDKIDRNLVHLQNDPRQKKEKREVSPKESKKREDVKGRTESEKEKEEKQTIDKLNEMQF